MIFKTFGIDVNCQNPSLFLNRICGPDWQIEPTTITAHTSDSRMWSGCPI